MESQELNNLKTKALFQRISGQPLCSEGGAFAPLRKRFLEEVLAQK